MLVLSRKPNESIIIGNITITVISIQGKKVSIGIEAPNDVQILRKEIIGKSNVDIKSDSVPNDK